MEEKENEVSNFQKQKTKNLSKNKIIKLWMETDAPNWLIVT